jgi:hypothetical protein
VFSADASQVYARAHATCLEPKARVVHTVAVRIKDGEETRVAGVRDLHIGRIWTLWTPPHEYPAPTTDGRVAPGSVHDFLASLRSDSLCESALRCLRQKLTA